MYAYVGSRTTSERNAKGDGISVFHFDPETSRLTPIQILEGLTNPSYLALDNSGNFLYAVHGDQSDISAFSVDSATGKISLLNTRSTGGKNPVHLSIDPNGSFVVVANHLGSNIAILPLTADGRLGPVGQLTTLDGPAGPHRTEQTQSKPHASVFDPSGKYVLVPDKGLDRIFTFEYENGCLRPTDSSFIQARECSGPRHAAFHPALPFVYVVNELDSTITTYGFNTGNGELSPLRIQSCLSHAFTGNNRSAAIGITKNGRFLYASNRGADDIIAFVIDPESGFLGQPLSCATRGKTPRHFSITPGDRFLLALNEESHDIMAFGIDPSHGGLDFLGKAADCYSPVCMVFSPSVSP